MCRVFYKFLDFDKGLFPKEKRRISKVAAYDLLFAAAGLLGYDIDETEIARSEKGKPYLKNGAFYFSISHCKNFVCVALSDSEIGIDAQGIGDVDPKVVERFMKKTPTDDISNTYLWTDYEAIGKYFGVGIPHSIACGDDTRISRFRVENFCISVCHTAKDVCECPETIISVK